jgi:hypothetical protein
MPSKFGLLADYVEVIRTIETSPCDKSQIRSERDPLYLDAMATDRECVRLPEEQRRTVVRAAYPNAAPTLGRKYGRI